jgi:hypothetical protein
LIRGLIVVGLRLAGRGVVLLVVVIVAFGLAAARLGVVVLLVVLGASGRGRGPGQRDARRRLAPPNRRSILMG